MSTAAISSTSMNQELQAYSQQRTADLKQLSKALSAGDINGAQQAYNAIVSLGQSGPFANGAPFYMANREQDFQAIGQALQAGDLSGATQALQTLRSTYQSTPSSSTSASSNAGPDFVVNLGGSQ